MTALNYSLRKDQVILSMDTLVCDEKLMPINFMTKIFTLPHINCIIGGVGYRDLILDLYNYTQTQLVAKDVTLLNREIAKKLEVLGQEYKDSDSYSAIYIFGYNSSENVYEGYAYRQKNDFKSEKLEYLRACRPGIDTKKIDELLEQYGDDEISLFTDLMIEQKNSQEHLPINEKTKIGGEVQLCILNCTGVTTITTHRFDDYDEKYYEMCSRSH